jgi:hypothetical protein
VLCAAALALPAGVAAQQPTPTPNSGQTPPKAAEVNPPVVSAHIQTPTVAVTKQKLDRYKGHVLVFNIAEVIVQSDANPKFIWAFEYSPELRPKVIELLNSGGYRNGDRIQVYCRPGTTIAVKFKGKPSG